MADENEDLEPGLIFDFYYEWDQSWDYVPYTFSGVECDIEHDENSLRMNMYGMDPSFYIEIPADIALEDYPYIKIRLKNESMASGIGEMYIIRDNEEISEDNAFHFDIGRGHDDFKNIIVNATRVKGKSWWKGALTDLRFDGLRNAAEEGGDTFFLEYIAFFASQEAAESFEPDRDQEPPQTAEPTTGPEDTSMPDKTEPEVTNKPVEKEEKDNKMVGIIIFVAIIVLAILAAVFIVIRARKR